MIKKEFENQFFKTVAFSLGVEPSSLSLNLSKDDITEWDSLGHLKLLLGLEEEFGIKFSMQETENLSSLKNIYNLIEIKIVHD